jgi:hypothetical protein
MVLDWLPFFFKFFQKDVKEIRRSSLTRYVKFSHDIFLAQEKKIYFEKKCIPQFAFVVYSKNVYYVFFYVSKQMYMFKFQYDERTCMRRSVCVCVCAQSGRIEHVNIRILACLA